MNQEIKKLKEEMDGEISEGNTELNTPHALEHI